jgi:FAD/FMN-containing dehydrogenase
MATTSEGSLSRTAVRELRRAVRGSVVEPDDDSYDEARTLFNAMIDKRPALIVQCAGSDDVAAAVRFGREHELLTAVRSGGHSVAGTSVCDGGLVIDVRPMKEIAVDSASRVARVGAGCTWGEFDRVAQEYGLATTGGRVSTTGVAGLTLGGGSGWLERKHGLACDNLAAVEIVTAAGDSVRASEDENPDLFWALHGGGGNFGVATSFEFRLHPVGPTVLAGLLLYPGERGSELLALFRDVMREAPDELGTAFIYATAPPEPEIPADLHGELVVLIAVCYAGPIDEGMEAVRPLRAFGPAADLLGPCAYADFQCAIDDPPGYRNYWTADYVDEMSEAAISAFVEHAEAMASGPSQAAIIPWGGAVARVPDDATPLTKRDAAFVVHPFSLWESSADDTRGIEWARSFSADMKRFATGGVYLNFVGNEGDDRIRAAYGPGNYDRLAAVKHRYDPDNFFRLNQNIKPPS